MTIPSSQILAVWVQEEVSSTDWVPLRQTLFGILKGRWKGASEEELWDCVDERVSHVADDLRNCISEWEIDGAPPRIEIDNEPSPYIRVVSTVPSELTSKLRRVDPFEFESICAKVLIALGASAHSTKKTADGGIDFLGMNLNAIRSDLILPSGCRSVVIGQAKRYKDGNLIGETKLREFVGAATLERHRLAKEGVIQPSTPVLLAFWTTSNFDPNSKKYARAIGIWYMDGATLSAYIKALGLEAYVMSLSDVLPVQPRV